MLKAKKIFFTLYLFSFHLGFYSQSNLVPNPSFEDTVNCPQMVDQAFKAMNWSSYRDSPDYFNSCDPTTNNVSTPYNFAGFQIPKSGNAYMGLLTYYTQTQLPDFREYIGAKLTSTLIVSQKYFFSMKCVATKSSLTPSNCYSDKLGVAFSKTSYNVLNPYPITNSAKVFTNALVNDTVNWTTIKGSFIADSAYQYIILGNFFSDNLTDTLIFDSNTNCWAYYFIDDVCVSTDSNFTYNYIPTGVSPFYKSFNNIRVFPTPANNTITVENSEKDDYYVIENLIGTRIKGGFLNAGKNNISVSNIVNGIYFLLIREKKIKIIINH